MIRQMIAAIVVGLFFSANAWSMTPVQRMNYRGQLLSILPDVPAFDDWVMRTDSLPPDFDALPKVNSLPIPLRFTDGRIVKTVDDWAERRAEIVSLFEQYEWGTFPPHPERTAADVEKSAGEGYRTRRVTLHYGADGKTIVHVTLVLPDGVGPFPVLIGPGLIGGMMGSSAPTLLRRGYIAASYAGNDSNDDSRRAGEIVS